jgi:hypothetical protein
MIGDASKARDKRRARPVEFSCVESLPFSVRIARTESDVIRVREFREAEYRHRHPILAEKILAEQVKSRLDEQRGTITVFAECLTTKAILGTVRFSSNLYRPFDFEFDDQFPAFLSGKPLAYFSRFAVAKTEYSKAVRALLIKSTLLLCQAKQINQAVVSVVRPFDRLYTKLGYEKLEIDHPEKVHDISFPVYLMGIDIATFQKKLEAVDQSLCDAIFQTYHPDLEIFSSVSSEYAAPRQHRGEPEVLRSETVLRLSELSS